MSNRENFSFVLFFITTRHVTIILYWFEPSLEITFNASSFVIYRYIMHWWGMFFVPTKWPISHLVSTRHIPHWGLNTHDSSFQMTFLCISSEENICTVIQISPELMSISYEHCTGNRPSPNQMMTKISVPVTSIYYFLLKSYKDIFLIWNWNGPMDCSPHPISHTLESITAMAHT